MSVITNIIRSATRKKDDTLKCLTFCRENERYLRWLSKCNCELYVIPKEGQSDWKTSIADIPTDTFILRNEEALMSRPFLDCIIVHDRLQEFDIAMSLSHALHLPIITVDHVSSQVMQKLPAAAKVSVSTPMDGRGGNMNVSLSDGIKKSWAPSSKGISITIPPCLQAAEPNSSEQRTGIVIDNNTPEDIMNALLHHTSEFELIPRFPEKSFEHISTAKVYINTWNNIDLKTLEAMQWGCITVSPRTPDTELIIEHEQNGLLFSDVAELSKILKKCLAGDYDSIVDRAYQTVQEYSTDEKSFIAKWNQIFSYISETFFLRN